MAADPKVTPLRKPQPCPECGKLSTRDSYPFCSERCRSIDLNRWFSGTYTIPVSETGENTEDDPDDRG